MIKCHERHWRTHRSIAYSGKLSDGSFRPCRLTLGQQLYRMLLDPGISLIEEEPRRECC